MPTVEIFMKMNNSILILRSSYAGLPRWAASFDQACCNNSVYLGTYSSIDWKKEFQTISINQITSLHLLLAPLRGTKPPHHLFFESVIQF